MSWWEKISEKPEQMRATKIHNLHLPVCSGLTTALQCVCLWGTENRSHSMTEDLGIWEEEGVLLDRRIAKEPGAWRCSSGFWRRVRGKDGVGE